MLTFDLDEIITCADIKSAKLTDTALKEVILSNLDEDKRAEEDENFEKIMHSKSGIQTKLRQLDDCFTMKGSNGIWKYDMLRLKKYFYRSNKKYGYNLFRLIKKPSYESIQPFHEYYKSSQSNILDEIEKDIEFGIAHQLKTKHNSKFVGEVHNQKNLFYGIMNDLSNASKRLYSFGDGRYYTAKYCAGVSDCLDRIHKKLYSISYEQNDTVFERFYQILVLSRAKGGSDTQIEISKALLEILNSSLTPVSTKASEMFSTYDGEYTVLDADSYVSKYAEYISDIIFDGTGITRSNGITKLCKPSNLCKIGTVYNLVNGETRQGQDKPNHKKRVQDIISLSRAIFALEKFMEDNQNKIKNKRVYHIVFNTYGYFTSENERSISMGNEIKRYNQGEKIKEQAVRLLLELSNICYMMYYGKENIITERLKLEIKFDEFISKVLDLRDYRYLKVFYKNYYPQLKQTVLSSDFLWHISVSVIGKPIIMTIGFADFLRHLILASCRSIEQSPMYYVEEFFEFYEKLTIEQHRLDVKFMDEIDDKKFEICISDIDYLKFDAKEL